MDINRSRRSMSLPPVPSVTLGVDTSSSSSPSTKSKALVRFKGTVLGGTFDHLHQGHKVMLTICALLATEYMWVGITGAPMLAKSGTKRHTVAMQSFEVRQEELGVFVNLVAPSVHLNLLLDWHTSSYALS